MYTSHFNLREKPFSLIPEASSIYFSRGHMAAFSILEFGLLEQVGVTVITGDVGAGKTTLLRLLLSRIDYEHICVGLISTPHSTFGSLLSWMVNAFKIPTAAKADAKLLGVFQEFLIQQFDSGQRTVVIVDEAQNMTMKDLESLRLLTNINADKNQLLQIILLGQPELLKKLKNPRLSQLAQRVSSEYHLQPLSMQDSMHYIRHRVAAAGGSEELFDLPALMALYYYSGGIPRIINTLCDGALVFAYGLDRKLVTLDIVTEVVKTKQIGGIHRPGLKDDPARQTVRAHVQERENIDLLDWVS
jgi:general secretion pathway protein A